MTIAQLDCHIHVLYRIADRFPGLIPYILRHSAKRIMFLAFLPCIKSKLSVNFKLDGAILVPPNPSVPGQLATANSASTKGKAE